MNVVIIPPVAWSDLSTVNKLDKECQDMIGPTGMELWTESTIQTFLLTQELLRHWCTAARLITDETMI